MHVISKKALKDFWLNRPEAQSSLEAWYRLVSTSSFSTFIEVKQSFNSADYVHLL
ncbi:MAG: type II toxin-antitoxin system HigB family toxin [Rhizonema sp. NSF051]|nr:type II toxin-antitoxin system HigB family toxin [Rhizonema sp. NSF051]